MVDNDDKYGDEEENLTQVRSIIKHLNEDKPSQERSREVVVRADGSKVVRVTKKRRVLMTNADKRRRSRSRTLLVFAVLFFAIVSASVFIFYRMSTMSGSAYVNRCQAELLQRWGAEKLQIEGAGVDGTTLKLAQITAEFPRDSMLQRIELAGIEAKIDADSYITGRIKSECLVIEQALIVLRDGSNMQMPQQNGMDMWDFRRIECRDFNIQFSDAEQSPVQLKNMQAYMYHPQKTKVTSVVMFRDGTINIKGWKSVHVAEGKAHISGKGIDDFSFSGTTDEGADNVEQRRSKISFAGKIQEGEAMTGPFSVESENMSLADFTDGRFEEIFTARTVAVSHGKLSGKSTIRLASAGESSPLFAGEFHLRDICLSSFPALMAITEHIEPSKRNQYNPLSLHRGYVVLGAEGDARTIEMPNGALSERDQASISGKLILNASNELSGELKYGIPAVLARVEYPDGLPDPIFQPMGEWAVLSTRIKGHGNMPGDDMAEVEARAAIARRDRPERMPFDKLDVNKMTDALLNGQLAPAPEAATPAATPVAPADSVHPIQKSQDNPFETAEDPFAPSLPF